MSRRDRWNDPYRPDTDPRATVARHRSALLATDGVVSVGIGFDASHRTVIVVGVTSEEATGGGAVPADLDGVPVETRVVGDLKAKGNGDE